MTARARALAVAAAVVTVALIVTGCSSGGGDRATKPAPERGGASTGRSAVIGPERAVEIARVEWRRREPDFDFSAVRPQVSVEGGTYDVAFVPAELAGAQGEPHVVVDRHTGAVRDRYRTR